MDYLDLLSLKKYGFTHDNGNIQQENISYEGYLKNKTKLFQICLTKKIRI